MLVHVIIARLDTNYFKSESLCDQRSKCNEHSSSFVNLSVLIIFRQVTNAAGSGARALLLYNSARV